MSEPLGPSSLGAVRCPFHLRLRQTCSLYEQLLFLLPKICLLSVQSGELCIRYTTEIDSLLLPPLEKKFEPLEVRDVAEVTERDLFIGPSFDNDFVLDDNVFPVTGPSHRSVLVSSDFTYGAC